eukprot:jgi/Psemu1/54492/gm1.54492_g
MPEPAVNWNEVRGIHFSFGHHFGCGNKQEKLNAAFAQILPNIASLFIVDDEDVKTLRRDPIPVLKSLIVAAIVDELPASEVFKAHKQRIALLLSNSAIFCHKKDHGRFRVRDKCGLDKAARRANNGNPIIRLVLSIFSWEFHEDWYPYEFHKVYDPGYGVPLDEAMLQRKTPFHTQTNNELKFNDKLIEQLKRERNGETVQQVLAPRRHHLYHHLYRLDLLPANYRWTFNPQSETVTFYRLPRPATAPLKPPSQLPLSDATADDPVFSCGRPTTFQTTSRCLEDKHVSLVCEHLVNELVLRFFWLNVAIDCNFPIYGSLP